MSRGDFLPGLTRLDVTAEGLLVGAFFVTGPAAVGLKVLLTTDAEWESLPETVRTKQQAVAPAF